MSKNPGVQSITSTTTIITVHASTAMHDKITIVIFMESDELSSLRAMVWRCWTMRKVTSSDGIYPHGGKMG